MKTIYQKQILIEKMRKNPHKGLIQRLQSYMEQDKPISKNIFFDSSILMSASDFVKSYTGEINSEAQTVMTYIGDNFIQSLRNGKWVAQIGDKEVTYSDIKFAEEDLWNHFKKTKLN
jgi:hypothetical protein